jgi:hypothetical protein
LLMYCTGVTMMMSCVADCCSPGVLTCIAQGTLPPSWR